MSDIAGLAWVVRAACALSLVLGLATRHAHAQGPAAEGVAAQGPAARTLMDARAALDEGEHQRAAALVAPLVGEAGVDTADRAEAWRVLGLARFFLGHYDQAEAAFLAYLRLDVDGRLDPTFVPPEVVSFFEDVRARNAAELRLLRPQPRRRPVWALNLVPPLGQLQNGHRTKGWALAGAGSALFAANLSSYLVLRRWCDTRTQVCQIDGESRADQARLVRSLNLASGVLLVGLWIAGVADGFLHQARGEPALSLDLVPTPGGGAVLVRAAF